MLIYVAQREHPLSVVYINIIASISRQLLVLSDTHILSYLTLQ